MQIALRRPFTCVQLLVLDTAGALSAVKVKLPSLHEEVGVASSSFSFPSFRSTAIVPAVLNNCGLRLSDPPLSSPLIFPHHESRLPLVYGRARL